jgi:methionyl-tRNA formyltransferase
LNREAGRLNWNESAEAIERKIRAYNPWPGAFMKIGGPGTTKNLKVFAASVIDLSAKPGKIIRFDEDIVIATGDRALSLTEVQLEGKRRMSAAEFLRGRDLSS